VFLGLQGDKSYFSAGSKS